MTKQKITYLFCALLFSASLLANNSDIEYNLLDSIKKLPTLSSNQYLLANSIQQYIYEEQISDELIIFYNTTPSDSIFVLTYYYFAEYCFTNELWQISLDYANRTNKLIEESVWLSSDNAAVKELLSDSYHLCGLNYYRLGQFTNAANAFNKTYQIDKTLNDPDRLSSTLNSIASTYVANKQPEEAKQYILEAIAVNSTINNLYRRSVLYGTASEIYSQLGEYEVALRYAQSGYDIEDKLGRPSCQGKRLSQKATALIGLQRTTEAKETINEAIPLLQETGVIHSVAICEEQLGQIALLEHDSAQATHHYAKAVDIFSKQNDLYGEKNARKGLYESLKTQNPKAAVVQFEHFQQLQDSIYKLETTRTMSEYNAQYHNDLLAKKIKENKARLRTYMILWLLVIIIFSIIAVGIVRKIKTKHKVSIEEKQQEIKQLQTENEQLNIWYQNAIKNNIHQEKDISETDTAFLNKVVDIVNSDMENGIGTIDATHIANALHISNVQLRNKIANLTGMTTRAYILSIRMEKACYLLRSKDNLNINEIAYQCGYDEPTNFIHAFRRHLGMSPKQYRDSITNDTSKQS